MNYWVSVAWHEGHQSADLQRCSGSPGCFDSSFQLVSIAGFGVSSLQGLRPGESAWPIKYSDTMTLKPGNGIFGRLVLRPNEKMPDEKMKSASPWRTLKCPDRWVSQRWRQKHLTWSKEKKDWTIAQWFNNVLFSDWTKCCISFGNKGPRVCRKSGPVSKLLKV